MIRYVISYEPERITTVNVIAWMMICGVIRGVFYCKESFDLDFEISRKCLRKEQSYI